MKHLVESIRTAHSKVDSKGYSRTTFSSILEPSELKACEVLAQDLVLSYCDLCLQYGDYTDSEVVSKKIFGPQLAKVYKQLKSASGIYLPQGTELKFKGEARTNWARLAYKYNIPSLGIDIIMPMQEGLFVGDFMRSAGLTE